MGDWMGVVLALAVGLPLLGVALWFDVRRRRRTEEELASPPVRNDPTVDALTPRYVTQMEVDDMTSPGRGTATAAPPQPGAVRLEIGHLDDDFSTGGGVAVLENASVLLVADDILTMRELLVPLSRATAVNPLVIAAASFHPEVVASLKANRRALRLPVVAVLANPAELLRLQQVVGGDILASDDLKAGWVPAQALGSVMSWRSDTDSVTLTGKGAGKA